MFDSDGSHNIGNLVVVFFPPQPLNYEKKKSYTLNIEGANTHLDFRFSHLGPFKDATMLKIIVGDVDEPPLFSMPSYIMEVYENAKIGTIVGTVLAQDPDSANSLVRYGMLQISTHIKISIASKSFRRYKIILEIFYFHAFFINIIKL